VNKILHSPGISKRKGGRESGVGFWTKCLLNNGQIPSPHHLCARYGAYWVGLGIFYFFYRYYRRIGLSDVESRGQAKNNGSATPSLLLSAGVRTRRDGGLPKTQPCANGRWGSSKIRRNITSRHKSHLAPVRRWNGNARGFRYLLRTPLCGLMLLTPNFCG
jgi:hypothetical protein